MEDNKDKLENFILNNKPSFDEDFNNEKVWEAIGRGIKPTTNSNFNWLAAASILLLLAVGWLITDRYNLNQRVNELENLTVSGRNYQEIENYYTQTVNEKIALIKEMSIIHRSPIEGNLKELQQNYKDLKTQLLEGIPHQKIIDAMIWNLREQVKILENHLEILEEVKEYSSQQNKYKNEKSI
jgi:hypothetical protein